MTELVTAAAAEVVALPDLKAWLRVESTADDAVIAAIGRAAREKAEAHTGRRFITQTQRLWLDGWPREHGREPFWDGVIEGDLSMLDGALKREIDLLLAPIQTVSSVKYYGTDSTEYLLSASDYLVDAVNVPGRLVLGYSKTWPSLSLRPAKAIAVEFVVGYGAAGSAVPDSIQTAIKMIATDIYEHRGDDETETAARPGARATLPRIAMEILDPYVVKRL